MDVDDTDRQVIAALVEDGRASVEEVSAATGISKPVVDQRKRELEDAGVIDGYEARIDYGGLGYDVTAVIQVTATNGERSRVANRLRADDRLLTVYEVTGQYDVVAVGKFRDTAELHEHVGELVGRERITGVSSAVVLDAVKEGELSVAGAD